MKFINKDTETDNNGVSFSESGKELDFNRKNREDYEGLMKDSSTQLDGYWDRNNPFVRLFLLILAVIIIGGSVYYILTYIGTK